MKNKTTKWRLVGAFLTAGIMLALAMFACKDGPGSSETTYTISKASRTANGKFTIDKKEAKAGETVTLTITSIDEGYIFESWTFSPASALKPTDVTDEGDEKYTFKMPARNITVNAKFKLAGEGTYTITKASTFDPTNGDFTITPWSAEEGDTITLVVSIKTANYQLSEWIFDPPLPVVPVESAADTWTFNMPAYHLTVSAAFSVSVPKSVTKGPSENGSFTINGGNETSLNLSVGSVVTLKPTPSSADYVFGGFAFIPPLPVAAVENPAGTWTFAMPSNGVTVNAYFPSKNSPHTSGTGTKTMTVKGGTGLPMPQYGKSNGMTDGYGMHTGTRDITVTVTMASGTITDVTYEGSIEWSNWDSFWLTQGQHRELNAAAAALVAAISSAKNADVSYTPSTTFTGTAVTAWTTYDTNIRKAVKDAAAAINQGKPNRVLTGGGQTPWLVDGAPLNGTTTAVGTSFMGGSSQPINVGLTSNPPTDMTVMVTVTGGFITDITVTTDDIYCRYGAPASGGGVPAGLITTRIPLWIERMKLNNKAEVDTVTGATVDATPYRLKTEKFLKLIGQRAFMKIVNEY